jgi:PAS domain S-box-containing protein
MFLDNGGQMGAIMRGSDWSCTALGGPDLWPDALKTSLSIVLNSPTLGAVLWGPDLIMFYNDAYIPSMADRHPSAMGKPVADVWGSAWDQVSPPFYRAMKTGEGFSQFDVELPMVRNGNAEVTYWNFTAAPIRDAAGDIVGLLNQGIEITDQVRANRLLAEERARTEKTLVELNASLEMQVADRLAEIDQMWNASPDLMLIIDFEGRFVRTNPSWQTLLGYSASELTGRHVNDFILEDDIDATRIAYETAAAGGLPKIINRYRHKDGSTKWFSWVAAPKAGLTYATARDITAEKAAEDELSKTREVLRQSQKMESVGQLTGGLAHDFNNILAGISGSLELIATRMAQGRITEADRYISAAQTSAKRAANLTQRLLAFSRRQTLTPAPVRLNNLVGDMIELLRRTVGPHIQIKSETANDLWPTFADVGQLENALLNLVLNARDAMPDGGTLKIVTENKILNAGAAKALSLSAGEYVSLCVEDDGTGMPADIQERAFEPFFTSKPIGEGTGLGLSMVHGFTGQSGGAATITSKLGEGTSICMLLPKHHGEMKNDLIDAVPALETVKKSKTILLVDDEVLIRMVACEQLEDLGYKVIEAGDAASALRLVVPDQPIDLLLTDVGLPGGMNGRQLADAVRDLRPTLPVIFITGYAASQVLNQGTIEDGMRIMTKPFQIEKLANLVKELTTTS